MTLGWTWELQNPSHFVTDTSPEQVLLKLPASSYSSGIKIVLDLCFSFTGLPKSFIPFVICISDMSVSQFSSPDGWPLVTIAKSVVRNKNRAIDLNILVFSREKKWRYWVLVFTEKKSSARSGRSEWKRNMFSSRFYPFSVHLGVFGSCYVLIVFLIPHGFSPYQTSPIIFKTRPYSKLWFFSNVIR